MLDLSQEDITEGPIARALLLLAAPLIAQSLVNVVQQVVDTFWVGRLGDAAVAAVGLNFPIMAVIFAFTYMPLVGTQVVVSQRVGGGDREGARRAAFHGLTLAFVMGVTLSLFVVFNARSIVSLVAGGVDDPRVVQLGAVYLATYLSVFSLLVMGDTLEMAFTGWGDSRAAFYVNGLAVAINLVLDPFLVLGIDIGPIAIPQYGVQGAAIATAAGYAVSTGLAFAFALGWRDTLNLSRKSVGFDFAEYREIIDIGLPVSAQQFVAQVVRVLVIGLVSVVGGAAGLAAYTVGARVASVAFIPAMGLQQATQSMIGQNLGADRPNRAAETIRVGITLAVGALTVIGAIQWLFPGELATLFVPDLTDAGFALTVLYLQILAYGYWAIGGTYVLLAGFNGARRTRTSFVVDLVKYWAVRLPIAVLSLPLGFQVTVLGLSFAPGMGLGMDAIFWAVTGSNVVAVLGVGAYYAHTLRDGMFERAAEQATAAD